PALPRDTRVGPSGGLWHDDDTEVGLLRHDAKTVDLPRPGLAVGLAAGDHQCITAVRRGHETVTVRVLGSREELSRTQNIRVVVGFADDLLAVRGLEHPVEIEGRAEPVAVGLDDVGLTLASAERVPVAVALLLDPAGNLAGQGDLLCGLSGVVGFVVEHDRRLGEGEQHGVGTAGGVLDAILKAIEHGRTRWYV